MKLWFYMIERRNKMGLGFNYGDTHFSYSGFHEFRTKLASLANLPYLDNMEGFSGSIKWI
jgi:hypothetical protein